MPNSDSSLPAIVVVGNGMVGHALCEKLVGLTTAGRCRVVVFGEEPHPAYDRVNLSQFFAGKTRLDLQLQSAQWYRDNNIELRSGQRITRIDRDRQRVFCGDDDSIHYDKLVLSTGSRPFVPPIDGIKGEGIFVYRTLEDLDAIEAYAQQVSSAAVLGGGLLGLEAARALLNLKLDTHVVEMAPSLMPRQLDNDGAGLLQEKVEAFGIHVHTLKRTEAIESRESDRILKFDTGDELAVGMVVVSAGIRPNDELAKDAGLDVGKRGGIAVNDGLQTSDENIYAIGECASHDQVIYGLVGPGYQMADVLAENLVHELQPKTKSTKRRSPSAFTGGDQSARLKLLGVDVTTLGSPIGEVPFATTITSVGFAEELNDDIGVQSDAATVESEKTYRKLILHKRQVVGALAVGPWEEIDRVQQAIAAGRNIWPWHQSRFERTGRLWKTPISESVASWPETATVCSCLRINRGALTAAKNSGCSTVDALACQTGALRPFAVPAVRCWRT